MSQDAPTFSSEHGYISGALNYAGDWLKYEGRSNFESGGFMDDVLGGLEYGAAKLLHLGGGVAAMGEDPGGTVVSLASQIGSLYSQANAQIGGPEAAYAVAMYFIFDSVGVMDAAKAYDGYASGKMTWYDAADTLGDGILKLAMTAGRVGLGMMGGAAPGGLAGVGAEQAAKSGALAALEEMGERVGVASSEDALSALERLDAAAAENAAAAEMEGIIYRRTNPFTGRQYYGQARNLNNYLARQSAEDNALRVNHIYDIMEYVPNDKLSLNLPEENYIRLNGGPRVKGGTLENLRYQMNDQAYREAGGTIDRPTD